MNETIKDILRELREDVRETCGPEDWETDRLTKYLRGVADRIEAAWKRERTEHINDIHDALYAATGLPGNAAAMREALEHIEKLTREFNVGNYSRPDYTQWVIDSVRFALSAPARNIDRFATEGEAWKFYLDHVPDNGNLASGYAEWLFATELIYGDAAKAEGGAE